MLQCLHETLPTINNNCTYYNICNYCFSCNLWRMRTVNTDLIYEVELNLPYRATILHEYECNGDVCIVYEINGKNHYHTCSFTTNEQGEYEECHSYDTCDKYHIGEYYNNTVCWGEYYSEIF